MSVDNTTYSIGVFDSGIGGLSVANAIYSLLPNESIIYFADTARVPYGPRPKYQIKQFSEEITAFLLEKKCKMIVVACNTATAAALNDLRKKWPHIPIVGMEPAVKPAAEATQNNKVGVLATLSTINSERYGLLMHRFASDVTVFENPCIGLVPLIETGKLKDAETKNLLYSILNPMLEAKIDTLVLGCTHYPFILPLLSDILGGSIEIIDPAPAIARQVERLLIKKKRLKSKKNQPIYHFYASGSYPKLDLFTTIPFSFDFDKNPLK